MSELEVRETHGTGSLYRMEIYHGGTHIGDWEQSQKQNLPRKRREIGRSAEFLLDTYAEHGKFVVRWNGKDKEVRKYQEGRPNPGLPAVRLGLVIPRDRWDWA